MAACVPLSAALPRSPARSVQSPRSSSDLRPATPSGAFAQFATSALIEKQTVWRRLRHPDVQSPCRTTGRDVRRNLPVVRSRPQSVVWKLSRFDLFARCALRRFPASQQIRANIRPLDTA